MDKTRAALVELLQDEQEVELFAPGELQALADKGYISKKRLQTATRTNLENISGLLPASFDAIWAAASTQPNAAPAAPLPRINEDQPLRKEDVQRMLDERLRSLHLRQGVVVSDSATSLGRDVLKVATVERLVTVTPAARTAATKLLQQAGSVGEQFKQAMQLDTCLKEASENGVQKRFSDLLKAKLPGKLRVHDVHTTTSVCQDLKPDIVVTTGLQVLPSSTVLVLDLKSQEEKYNRPANIHQLALYGRVLLNQLPAGIRNTVLLAVTDLRYIQFLCVTRQLTGTFSYQLSEEMGETLAVLCAVLLADPKQYGASPPPALTIKGRDVPLLSYLGAGATSSVYTCELPSNSGLAADGPVAAKVPHKVAHNIDHELFVLNQLADGASCPCIPRVVGQLDHKRGLLLSPVGESLATRDILVQHPQLFRGFERLVAGLRASHDKGWAHRDVRPGNLVLVQDSDLYLIDWGCATRLGSAAAYRGTIKYASNRVLELLHGDASHEVESQRSDDLESLVKTMFGLSHELEAQTATTLHKEHYGELRQAWDDLMNMHPAWQSLMVFAAAADYDAVGKGLAARFD